VDTTITGIPGENSATRVTENVQTQRHLGWRLSTVVSITTETSTAKSFRLRLPEVSQHLAGQHYILRLTAPDGYTAARSYSIASPPDNSNEIDLTIERLPEGEVSEFLHEVVVPGDTLEVRGPIGGWFVWRADRPAILIGGGSGVVPLMAMLRLARNHGVADLLRLLVSVRKPDELFYAKEITGPQTAVIYSNESPPGSSRPTGRLQLADIPPLQDSGLVYICGSERFAEAAADLVLASGVTADRMRIEKFGPSG
jgi:ferredoxin-NADP reductase